MNTTKLNQLITVTALTLGTLLSGCKKADYKDITTEIVGLKKDFADACNNKSNHNIYNVCSSRCFSVRQIIEILEKKTGKQAKIMVNPEFTIDNERKMLLKLLLNWKGIFLKTEI